MQLLDVKSCCRHSRYTSRVNPSHRRSLFVAVLLVWLQAIAPFVHGHVGGWHVGGWHVAIDAIDLSEARGAVAAASAHADRVLVPEHMLEERDSPAVGVERGLRPSGDATVTLAALLAGLAALPLLRVQVPRPARTRAAPRTRPLVPRLRPANAPPPAIAPPPVA